MFRKDRLGRRGGGVILYIKESIQANEIKLGKGAECEEAVWYNIVTGIMILLWGILYSGNLCTILGEKIKRFILFCTFSTCASTKQIYSWTGIAD